MAADGAEVEVEYLRAECERLRKDRDIARRERQDAEATLESESSVRLRLLAETLSVEIKERFLKSLKNALWTATLLIGIASAGGLWKLSDIVSAKIDEKVKEKEEDVAQLRQHFIQSVIEFERQAKNSLTEIQQAKAQIAKESDQATGDIRQARAKVLLEVDSSGSAAWFGTVGDNVAAIAGSRAGQLAYEDGTTESGAFSTRFQRALQNAYADINRDGRVSIGEAEASTRTLLKRDGFDQVPTIAGAAKDAVALFSSNKMLAGPQYKKVIAVVVGINKYAQPNSILRGAVNDAKGFARLLEQRDGALFAESRVSLLTDDRATYSAISAALSAMRPQVGKDDLVIFYFSGHVATIGEGSDIHKVMYATDGEFGKRGYLRIDEVVKSLGAFGAKHALMVVDG